MTMKRVLDRLLSQKDAEDGVSVILQVAGVQYAGAVRKKEDEYELLTVGVNPQTHEQQMISVYVNLDSIDAVMVPQDAPRVVTPKNGNGLVIPGLK